MIAGPTNKRLANSIFGEVINFGFENIDDRALRLRISARSHILTEIGPRDVDERVPSKSSTAGRWSGPS